jgi:hypothetical protein
MLKARRKKTADGPTEEDPGRIARHAPRNLKGSSKTKVCRKLLNQLSNAMSTRAVDRTSGRNRMHAEIFLEID